jgi:RNA polymerase sigma factor (sigma-70 family)
MKIFRVKTPSEIFRGDGDMGKIDIEQLFIMYSERLKILAYSITKDWYTAEDVVQEAFIKAYNKIDTVTEYDKVGSWLIKITSRTAIDFLRAEKRRNWVRADLDFIEHLQFRIEEGISTEEEVDIILFKEAVDYSINQLADPYQQVLVLRIQYGLKEAEIAHVLKLKSTTVKTRLYRARQQLKQAMIEKHSA